MPRPSPWRCTISIAATDPLLDRVIARRARPVMLAWAEALVQMAGPAETRGEALCRHAIVDRALDIRRDDITVRNWAYTYRYFGRPVPPRVVAMPRLRMVRQEKETRALGVLWKQLDDDVALGVGARVATLLSRSPVTELLRSDFAPEVRFGAATLAVLSDGAVRGGIARLLAVRDPAVTDPRLGRALDALLEASPPPDLVVPALALAFELSVVRVLDTRGPAAPTTASDVPGGDLFAALLPVLLDSPGALAPLVRLDPGDHARVASLADGLRRTVGAAALRRATRLVALAAGPSVARAEVLAESPRPPSRPVTTDP